MALTGNIEIFPLPEILRLLARSGKNGCLQVETGETDGRIFIQDGSMTLATVSSDGEVLDQLAAAGVVDLDRLSGREMMDLAAALTVDTTPDELSDAVREHVVESLYRIRRPGRGSFEFLVDVSPRFRTGQQFDIESLVTESDRRAADWSDIERTIDDLDLPVRMARDLSVPEVTVDASTWRVLSVLEGGATIREVARQLGTTGFRAAREVAGLIRAELIEAVPTVLGVPETRHVDPGQTPVWHTPEPETAADDPTSDPTVSPWSVTAEPVAGEMSPDPWTLPDTPSTPDSTPGLSEEDASVVDEPTSDRSAGWWTEAMGQNDDIGEVDTDEFLESVFADEPASDEEPEESGFSMGLLRRRRLGPVSRDLTDHD